MTLIAGGRWLYALLALLFVAAVSYQVFLAGSAIFVDSLVWRDHRSFVHMFEFIPILMPPLTWIVGLPRALRLLPLLAVLLVAAQYATIRGAVDVKWLGALHPVNALLISLLSIGLSRSAWRKARRPVT